MTLFAETAAKLKKPRPRLLEKREQQRAIDAVDRLQRQQCRVRSGGQCEVVQIYMNCATGDYVGRRCPRRASQNHHLIGGSGRRNKGKSILAAHRIDTCDRCHEEITNHVLVPVDGTQREDAKTVRYERRT